MKKAGREPGFWITICMFVLRKVTMATLK